MTIQEQAINLFLTSPVYTKASQDIAAGAMEDTDPDLHFLANLRDDSYEFLSQHFTEEQMDQVELGTLLNSCLITPLPTNEQLESILLINRGLSEMHDLRLLNDDRAEDYFSAALDTLCLPEDEDDDDAPSAREIFWELCDKRGLI
ncbi:hypothetical protein N9997_01535 [Synechococcus sp. AH-603-L18]|nr:hypothetical protein [Synechococcus sp. AH-603-L18]MDB4338005.1 hypothetical protein [Synechococcus sp. AH-603-L18]